MLSLQLHKEHDMSIINIPEFISDIESIHQTLTLSYMESVVYWCEAKNLDVEIVSSVVKNNRVLKSRIMQEAEDLNFMKKRGAKLPI